MNPLGYTVERYPVYPGEKVWEPQQVRLPGVTMRKDTPTDEDPKAVTDTYIRGKLIWQPVEVLVTDSLPSPSYRRHKECFTYCESLNLTHGNQSHAEMH
jgi:hypothetical protein